MDIFCLTGGSDEGRPGITYKCLEDSKVQFHDLPVSFYFQLRLHPNKIRTEKKTIDQFSSGNLDLGTCLFDKLVQVYSSPSGEPVGVKLSEPPKCVNV